MIQPTIVRIAGGWRNYFRERQNHRRVTRICRKHDKEYCVTQRTWDPRCLWGQWERHVWRASLPFDTSEAYELGLMGDTHYEAFMKWWRGGK